MASGDTFFGKRISETYTSLLQVTTGGTVLDGSGTDRSLFVNSNLSATTIFSGSTELWSVVQRNISGLTTVLKFGNNALNPSDNTSYYIGEWASEIPSTTAASKKINCPNIGVVKNVFINIKRSAVTPSPDISSFYLRIYDTTSVLQREDFICTMDLAPTDSIFTGKTMSIPLSSNTAYCEIRLLTPVWVTGATNVFFGGAIFIN